MRRIVATAVVLALTASAFPAAAGRASRQDPGTVQGVALSANKTPLGSHTVQLRNVRTGELAGSTTSNPAGQFTFTGVHPGNYIVEVVDAAGNIVGTTIPVAVTAGTVATVTVTATALGALAAAGAAGGLSLAVTVASVVAAAAAVAGVTAIVAARAEASPSR